MRAPRRSKVSRGQATVELALSLLVFVSVLAFGIHFAEVGYLSLKVHESAAFAIWDATGRRVNSYSTGPNDSTRFDAVKAAVPADATSRYGDFDGVRGTGDNITQVFTKGTSLAVKCETNNGLNWSPDSLTARVYPTESRSLRCSSSAKVGTVNFPQEFAQRTDGDFFKVRNQKHTSDLTICAIGRAYGSGPDRCSGTVSVMLGDWGLSGGAENDPCKNGGGCGPHPYRDAVRRMWSAPSGAADDFAATWAGGAGTSSGAFHFSYVGEEGNYKQDVLGGHVAFPAFTTGGVLETIPGYGGCFLGRGC